MSNTINKVAVIGAGTMGAGIAGLCAATGCDVVLLDIKQEIAQKGVDRLCGGRNPAITEEQAAKITAASLDDLQMISDCDWICEAVVEDLQIKRDLFTRLESARKDGSIITTNTSGIPLRDIYADMPDRLQQDIAVTHFFNPVHIMKLVELVPGSATADRVTEQLSSFLSAPLGEGLGKGVVNAKDTVNFIGNRIGCFWMLAGLHKARNADISMETVDALMSKPVGLPPTGLYGLIDLIGLDVMDFVGKNLEQNLPANDTGRAFVKLPETEADMLANNQLGRKSGGGFYKMLKADDGSKSMQVYDLQNRDWRAMQPASLDASHQDIATLLFADDAEGQFAWDLMSETFLYAASLVPEISDDIVNIDRAMQWGFNWANGPFALMDLVGADKIADKLQQQGKTLPGMLKVLSDNNLSRFYEADGSQYLGLDGKYHPVSQG
jgi:3-hydroxyacyl-CoA dehydrogenase